MRSTLYDGERNSAVRRDEPEFSTHVVGVGRKFEQGDLETKSFGARSLL
jgi:hypothetical protein